VTRDELTEAEAAFRHALQINPYDYHSCHQLAGVMRRLRQPDQAAMLEGLATEGSALRKVILQLPDVSRVSPELLERIARYAASSGDSAVANRIYARLRAE
jgi:uncharacterized protein YecE (DUF72 family)